jgi:hypothetical protein
LGRLFSCWGAVSDGIYRPIMTFQRDYTDDDLRAAVAAQTSWRGVLRALGLVATSAGSMRTARRHADRLGISYAHFTGQRRWSDEALAGAVRESRSWSAVARALGLDGGSSIAALKGHAVRLGLDYSHFQAAPRRAPADDLSPNGGRLFRAGALLAAAWFEASGATVAWPLEPARYDLLAHLPAGPRRVQVKTTLNRAGSTFHVVLSTSSHSGSGRRVYDPDEIDEFFIIDGDLNFYRIPIAVVGGRKTARLSAYEAYRVPGFDGAKEQRSGVAS